MLNYVDQPAKKSSIFILKTAQNEWVSLPALGTEKLITRSQW